MTINGTTSPPQLTGCVPGNWLPMAHRPWIQRVGSRKPQETSRDIPVPGEGRQHWEAEEALRWDFTNSNPLFLAPTCPHRVRISERVFWQSHLFSGWIGHRHNGTGQCSGSVGKLKNKTELISQVLSCYIGPQQQNSRAGGIWEVCRGSVFVSKNFHYMLRNRIRGRKEGVWQWGNCVFIYLHCFTQLSKTHYTYKKINQGVTMCLPNSCLGSVFILQGLPSAFITVNH